MSRKIALTASLTTAIAAATKLAEKLEAQNAKVADLKDKIASIDAIEALDVGSSVIVVIGRADTRQEVIGRIVAVKAGEVIPAVVNEETGEEVKPACVGPRLFKVEFTRSGDAFDNEFTITDEDKVRIPSEAELASGVVAAEEKAEPVAEAEPLEAAAPAAGGVEV